MKVGFDDYGLQKRFTLKPIKTPSRYYGRVTYYEINLGWVWFGLWVRK